MHNVRSKSPPWGYTPESNSRGLPDPPPPLGLDIDRCIILIRSPQLLIYKMKLKKEDKNMVTDAISYHYKC